MKNRNAETIKMIRNAVKHLFVYEGGARIYCDRLTKTTSYKLPELTDAAEALRIIEELKIPNITKLRVFTATQYYYYSKWQTVRFQLPLTND